MASSPCASRDWTHPCASSGTGSARIGRKRSWPWSRNLAEQSQNGTGGTGHGTGSAAFLPGGAVSGGKFGGDWPGLAPEALFQGRDLAPAKDIRPVFMAVLQDH